MFFSLILFKQKFIFKNKSKFPRNKFFFHRFMDNFWVCNYLKKFLNIWPNVLFLAGSLFCVITWSSSVNLIGVFITGFGDILPVLLPFTFELFSFWSFVKSVTLDARYGVTGRSLILFNENALPPNSERAWLILFDISGLTDKLFTLPYFGRFLSSILP